ncbi:MAG TPA: hypothetical protein VGU25_10170 [Acidobacteriaceae bacterium]|nr:hypothetical protein [Acidobacteriaceae bacterium]
MATSTAHPQAHARFSRLSWKTLAVVLPFLLLFWVDIAHHTMFFDEVNAWAISAASPTLSKLFYYVHFEGHPWLWYFILWFPSRLTHDPVGMKWVEAALGTANILILGLLSPFTYKQRALILGSYFLVWEYTVMCRMYSVMLLLVLLYVVLRLRKPDCVVGCCALLGLAGNTDMTGVLLSGALLVEYAYSSYFDVAREQRRAVIRRWVPGVLAYVALVGLSIATLWPAKQISWQSSGHLGSHALDRHRIQASIGNMVAAPWWPISPKFPHHFWETSVVEARWLYLLVPVVLFAYWWTFRRDRNLLLLMGCTLAFGILFADFVYEGRVRHWGISFVSFVVGLWLQSVQNEGKGERRVRWSRWTYLLLGMSAVAGAFAVYGSWAHPFSRAREAAFWLKQNEPNAALVGAGDVSFGSVAEEMQRPVYFLECRCVDTFKLFSKDREVFPESQLPLRFNLAMQDLHTNQLVFVFYRPLADDDTKRLTSAGLQAVPLTSFPGADSALESFYIYRISRKT